MVASFLLALRALQSTYAFVVPNALEQLKGEMGESRSTTTQASVTRLDSPGGGRWFVLSRSLLLITLLLVGAGCGTPSSETPVGKACTDGLQCGEQLDGAACIVAWAGGYCTEVDCRLGSCPSGSRCVTGIKFSNVDIEAFCLSTCETTSNCRQGYICSNVGGGENVCAPSS